MPIIQQADSSEHERHERDCLCSGKVHGRVKPSCQHQHWRDAATDYRRRRMQTARAWLVNQTPVRGHMDKRPKTEADQECHGDEHHHERPVSLAVRDSSVTEDCQPVTAGASPVQ